MKKDYYLVYRITHDKDNQYSEAHHRLETEVLVDNELQAFKMVEHLNNTNHPYIWKKKKLFFLKLGENNE